MTKISLSDSGSLESMGKEYAEKLSVPLQETKSLLLDYFMTQGGYTYDELLDKAMIFYNRYPSSLKDFINGMSLSESALSLNDCIILLSMETLSSLKMKFGDTPPEEEEKCFSCSFAFLSGNKTETGYPFVGRLYDFFPPFDAIAEKNLIITVFPSDPFKAGNKKEDDERNTFPSTALVGLPGQIYCPTCVNSLGIFSEFNNGEPSGGTVLNENTTTMLGNLFLFDESSSNFEDLDDQLSKAGTDYSLIVNTVSGLTNEVNSYEFSTTLGMRKNKMDEKNQDVYVSTNYFQNSTWDDEIPVPTDENSWMGVTRRNNLMKLLTQKSGDSSYSFEEFKQIMNTTIDQGGAVWKLSIYQIVMSFPKFELCAKSTKQKTFQCFSLLDEMS